MKKAKLFLIALIVSLLVITQFAMVSAAPSYDEADFIAGTIDQVTLATDPSTGVITVEITLTDDQGQSHTVLVSEKKAYDLGLIWYDVDGPRLLDTLPETLEIPLTDILPADEEGHHPVATALAAFFSKLPGVDYEVIMAAHEDGHGFGVIAQALWLTQKMDGDADLLAVILDAKSSGDYSAFTLEDGTVPANWGQLRKAIMSGDKKNNLGVVMSDKDKDNGKSGNNGNGNAGNHDSNKDKNKEKSNNGNNGNNENKENNGKNKP